MCKCEKTCLTCDATLLQYLCCLATDAPALPPFSQLARGHHESAGHHMLLVRPPPPSPPRRLTPLQPSLPDLSPNHNARQL